MDGHFALEQNKISSMVKASLRVKLCVSKVVLTNISAILRELTHSLHLSL